MYYRLLFIDKWMRHKVGSNAPNLVLGSRGRISPDALLRWTVFLTFLDSELLFLLLLLSFPLHATPNLKRTETVSPPLTFPGVEGGGGGGPVS